MKIDTNKLDLELARKCCTAKSLESVTSSVTIAKIRRGGDVSPRIVGKISEFLNVDPSAIV